MSEQDKLCTGCKDLSRDKDDFFFCGKYNRRPFPSFKSGEWIVRRSMKCLNEQGKVESGS